MTNKQVEELLDEFDFGKVKKVMDFLEWTYWDTEDTKVSIGELRRCARYVLECAFKAPDSAEYWTGTGGFEVTRNMYPGDTQKYLSLKFIVAEWSNPCV